MAALFVLLAMMGLLFLIIGANDIWTWIHTKNEVKIVDQWDRFCEFGKENSNDVK